MFSVADGTDPRVVPPGRAGERDTLAAFLDWQRETLWLKCSGLDATGLAARSVPPSELSLLGLLRHLAEAERHWFRRVLAGEPVGGAFGEDSWAGAVAEADVVARARATWRAETDYARRFVAAAPSLDITGEESEYGTVSLRWVLVHLVEEYARHNGHADLLRERIDGAVGE
jgi:uncharacterized damage-inducible protein DinB